MRLPIRISLVFVSLTLGCASPPKVAISTEHGKVRANDARTAEEFARTAVDTRQMVASLLPSARQDVEYDIWLQDELDFSALPLTARPRVPWWIGGAVVRSPFHARPFVLLPLEQRDWILAHELVHLLLDSTWSPLPSSIEEGLCEYFGSLADPVGRHLELLRSASGRNETRFELDYLGPGPRFNPRTHTTISLGIDEDSKLTLEEIVTLDRPMHRLQAGDAGHVYATGYLIVLRLVDRIGLDGLYALCRSASRDGLRTVPAAWILAAAELEDNAAVDEFAYELMRAVVGTSDDLLEMIAWVLYELDLRDASPERFLAEHEPSLRFNDRDLGPLAELPGFGPWIRREWARVLEESARIREDFDQATEQSGRVAASKKQERDSTRSIP